MQWVSRVAREGGRDPLLLAASVGPQRAPAQVEERLRQDCVS